MSSDFKSTMKGRISNRTPALEAKEKALVSCQTREPVIHPKGEPKMFYEQYHTATDPLPPALEAARPSWADRAIVYPNSHAEGNGEGWAFDYTRGNAEVCTSYNPHTGVYLPVTGFINKTDDLTLDDMEQMAHDLLAVVAHVRNLVGVAQ